MIANPDVLGKGVKVVTVEYGQWVTQAGSVERDRLDVLGLGTDGRLVVAELKRGAAPDTVEMQALKHAAMASRFTPDKHGEVHAAFLKSRGEIPEAPGPNSASSTRLLVSVTPSGVDCGST